jgi:hypothetical protein
MSHIEREELPVYVSSESTDLVLLEEMEYENNYRGFLVKTTRPGLKHKIGVISLWSVFGRDNCTIRTLAPEELSLLLLHVTSNAMGSKDEH